MPGPSREIQLRLFRDSLSTPWGFRLHGGKDLKLPLTVQKVNLGSPVDGELCRGDVILEIQNCDATTMTHQKAQDMIKNSGGSLLIRVRRSVGCPEPPPTAPAPVGIGGTPGPQGFMMHRVQDTLSNLAFGCSHFHDPSPGGALYNAHSLNYGHNYDDYDHHHHLHHQSPPAQPFPPTSIRNESSSRDSQFIDRLYSTLPKQKSVSQLPTGLEEPGWTPKKAPGPVGRRTQPPSRANQNRWPNPSPQAPPVVASSSSGGRPRSLTPEPPAWQGSLRPFMNPHLTDMRVQLQPKEGPTAAASSRTEIARFSPGNPSGARGGRSSAGWAEAPGAADAARVANLQYNSPLALYSKASADEALYGQRSGWSGGAQ